MLSLHLEIGALSPPARGGPSRACIFQALGGLIPACAGLAASCRSTLIDAEMDPRACGADRLLDGDQRFGTAEIPTHA